MGTPLDIVKNRERGWYNEERGVLARSKFGNGSLELTIDDTGLRYKFDAPNTQLGDELLEGIRRGDISTSSFAFKVEEDKWEGGTRIVPQKAKYSYTPAYIDYNIVVPDDNNEIYWLYKDRYFCICLFFMDL